MPPEGAVRFAERTFPHTQNGVTVAVWCCPRAPHCADWEWSSVGKSWGNRICAAIWALREVFPLPDGAEDLAVDFHMDVPVWRGLYPGVQWPDPEES